MKVCVQGLWHLGSVTAACLAAIGNDVCGLDLDQVTVDALGRGIAPILEPGLNDLLAVGTRSGNLRFSSNREEAVAGAAVLWVAFDTPVDDDDRADISHVIDQVQAELHFLNSETIVIVSSQLPVGSIRRLEAFARERFAAKRLRFACFPENLRLGKALDSFMKPDRIVVGVRSDDVRPLLEELLLPITKSIEWMSIESAEMTKHAINAFFATSVTFANEIASICELVGADAKQVERGMKTESRIGPKAYLSPGGPFAGGTLARDVEFLVSASSSERLVTPLLSSVRPSNDGHKGWVRRKLLENFVRLESTTVAVWGLTYKPGTSTLRRSLSVELCDWLIEKGARVIVHDPAVESLPHRWLGRIVREKLAVAAVASADVLIVGTDWPEYRTQAAELVSIANPRLVVIDSNRHLRDTIPKQFKYIAVGTPTALKE